LGRTCGYVTGANEINNESFKEEITMMKPRLQKIFTIPLWEREAYLIIGSGCDYVKGLADRLKLSRAIKDEITYDNLDAKNTAGCAYFCLDKGIAIVWFPSKRVAKEILAHEVTHIVDELMKFIGAERESEARAYTVEWIFKHISNLLR